MNGNDRAIVGLVMVAHAMVHTLELSIPILVTIWLVEFSVTTATMGLAVTVGMALFGIGALPAGVLVDAYGSQRLIAGCLVGMGLSFLVLGLADSFLLVTLALVLWGVAASVYHPAGLALISKGVTPADRGRAFGYHGMAGNVGIALGPLVTAILLMALDWRTVVAVLAVPAGLAAAFALRADVEETAGIDESTGRANGGSRDTGSISSLPEFLADTRRLFVGAFFVVFGVAMLSGIYYRGVITFLPELLGAVPAFAAVEFGETEFEPSRYVYAGLLVIGVAGQYLGGYLVDRFPREWGVAAAFGALTVATVLFLPAVEAGVGPLLVASAFLGFTMFVVQPINQALIADYSSPEVRGLSYGYTYFGVFGVGALGATLAGTALVYSEATMFLTFAAVAAAAAGLGLVLSYWRSRKR